MDFKKLKYETKFSFKNRIMRLIWNFVYFLFFRLTPSWTLNTWRIFILKIFGAKIGKGCIVYPTCKIWAPWNLEMGDLSVLADGVDCYNIAKITIGSKVAVSQRSFLCTGSHDITSLKRPLTSNAITLENHAWICAETFVAPGVIIKEGAVAGARAVVLKDVNAWHVVGGNPASFIKKRVIK
jgi:putative colanic acid biosynthesis acetyltransferase WcaF